MAMFMFICLIKGYFHFLTDTLINAESFEASYFYFQSLRLFSFWNYTKTVSDLFFDIIYMGRLFCIFI